MPGQRQPTDVIIENGRKHLSRAEEAERRQREVRIAPAKTAKPPKWLPQSLRADFRKLGKMLIAAGLYTDLDADVLARYLVAHHQWALATAEVEKNIIEKNVLAAASWTSIQSKHFRAARDCASDLGLSVSSRCRLALPPSSDKVDDVPEDEFTKALRARQGKLG